MAVTTDSYRPNPSADALVSEEALDALEVAGAAPADIVEDRALSNCIAYNFPNVEDAVMNRAVTQARRRVDAIVTRKVRALFSGGRRPGVFNSGHFWYPPGGFMSWHHNLRTPGWRLYVTYAEEPGKSFFRYRHPDTGEIVTLTDRQWDFRLFEIAPERTLWHAVRSETHRFSIGYRILPRPSWIARVERKLRRWTGLGGPR